MIISERDAKDPRRLVEALEAARVTRLVLVPSLLREILALPDEHRAAAVQPPRFA